MQKRRRLMSVLVLGLLLALLVGSGSASLRAAPAYHPAADASDDDFYDALAIGVPWEDLGKVPVEDAGAINVLYGNAAGLSSTLERLWSQNSGGVDGTSEAYDAFGSALAIGDFDGDGYYDLAVGVPGEDVGETSAAGIVHVLYGSATGITTRDERWDQSGAIEGELEVGDGFGSALTTGDFNGDGYDDLAVGVPREDKGDETDSGAVNVIYGSSEGLTTTGNQIWDQDDFFSGTTEPGDMFGSALAAGYFNADAYADLAIGSPSEDWGETEQGGLVHVMYGTSTGLSADGGQRWDQNNILIDDTVEPFDRFGHALCAGDFDGDGVDDLAVGVPGENVDGKNNAGAVHVLYLYIMDFEFWYQDGTYVRDDPESGDRFGSALAAGDFDGNGHDDLAVGVPDESVLAGETTVADAGAVNVLYGDTGGLTTVPPQLWHQGFMPGTAEADDGFGETLAAGDFNGDGREDLAIGVPFEDIGDEIDAGAVNVIYGSGSGLSSNLQFWHQDQGISGSAEDYDGFGMALVAIPIPKRQVFLPLVLR